MIFIVQNKATGAEVDRYGNDVMVELPQYPFTDFDYAPEVTDADTVTDVVPTAWTWTKLEYLRRFTQDERIAIRTAAKQVPALEDYLQLMELATEVRSDDPDVMSALTMLEGAGLICAGRAQEILHG